MIRKEQPTTNLSNRQKVSCAQNLCNEMNTSEINKPQPTTIRPPRKQYRFYPTETNTTDNPFGVSDEVIERMKQKPIMQRPVSCYVRSLVDAGDYNGDLLPLGSWLHANSSAVKAVRIEPSWIEKMRLENKLPIFTPCCVLRCVPEIRNFYPINYTCLLDFDIRKDDNPTINFDELKLELSTLPQIAYCGLATNGIDLFCIVPISTPQRYADHVLALVRQFRESGIIVRANESVTHIRTLSSDPDGYFNENAVEYRGLCQ